MQEFNWIQIGVGVLFGGLAGAIAKYFFDNWRNRIQPIGLILEVKSFYDSHDNRLLNSQVTLTGTTREYKFSRLYTGTIAVINKGNVDYPEFTFGLTGPDNLKIIYAKPSALDRHHEIEIVNEPTLENQVSHFDLKLRPFNRRDIYSIDFLLTSDTNDELKNQIKVSSKHPIKWSNPIKSEKFVSPFLNHLLMTIAKS